MIRAPAMVCLVLDTGNRKNELRNVILSNLDLDITKSNQPLQRQTRTEQFLYQKQPEKLLINISLKLNQNTVYQ